MNLTKATKTNEIKRNWILIDAKGQRLGKVAVLAATYLRGKNKPNFSPNIDCGDFVIIINSAKIDVYPQKLEKKFYYRHSGYPGGLKKEKISKLIAESPNKLIYNAIKGMIDANKLRDKIMKKLKIYSDENFIEKAQKPKLVKVN